MSAPLRLRRVVPPCLRAACSPYVGLEVDAEYLVAPGRVVGTEVYERRDPG